MGGGGGNFKFCSFQITFFSLSENLFIVSTCVRIPAIYYLDLLTRTRCLFLSGFTQLVLPLLRVSLIGSPRNEKGQNRKKSFHDRDRLSRGRLIELHTSLTTSPFPSFLPSFDRIERIWNCKYPAPCKSIPRDLLVVDVDDDEDRSCFLQQSFRRISEDFRYAWHVQLTSHTIDTNSTRVREREERK